MRLPFGHGALTALFFGTIATIATGACPANAEGTPPAEPATPKDNATDSPKKDATGGEKASKKKESPEEAKKKKEADAKKQDEGAKANERLPRRKLPNYGNRGPQPTTAGDVALGGLRVLMSPLYLVTEYGIRRPLEAAVPALERTNVPKAIYDFLFFGPDHKIGVVPTILADFGVRPSVGLYAFWNDAGVPGHDLVLHGSTWGPNWLAGAITDRVRFDKGSSDNESFSFSAVARPDHVYYGLGPRSLQGAESRYGETKIELSESIDKHANRFLLFHASIGVRGVHFYDGENISGDPTLGEAVARGLLQPPPGYLHDYTIFSTVVRLTADSRPPKAASGTGVRLEVGGEHDASLRDGERASWVKYGGNLTGAIDLNDRQRVLSLSAKTLFVDPIRSDVVIPFTELVSLGGTAPMVAYLAGRMVGRSAFVASLDYRWPVWNELAGTIKFEFGNVFDAHLDDFAVNLLRFSGSIGLETSAVSDNPLQLLFGLGSETFEQGGKIDSVRLFLGTTTNGL